MLVVVLCGNKKLRIMSNDKTQPGVRINSTVWKQFRQDVQDRKGGINGYLGQEVENALTEYMNASHGGDTHDRLTEIEKELRDMRALLESGEQKQKDSGVSSTTENRLREIRNRIDEETNGSPKVHNEVVELAIRQIAGSSKPTIKRYKELLQDDNELFPHPANESMYFRDASNFTQAVNALRRGGKIRQSEYDSLVEQYGMEWWKSQLPSENDIAERGVE